jgi:hypothetical protein
MIAIAMTTCPRARPTMEKSLASLRAAGFDQDVSIIHDPEKIGALKTWHTALNALVERTTEPFLMVLQDDTSWAIGARPVLEREIVKLGERGQKAGLLSPFLVNKIGREFQLQGKLKVGWHPSRLGYSSGGALCYILPRRSAETLLADPWFIDCVRERPKNIDRWVPGRFLELGFECLYRYPSLVNHALGSGNSSIKAKKPHDTAHWRPVA